jgi:UDP-N-acetylmuramoyl-tripeptide--D-alanyl-D-alanine ligase
MLCGLDLKTCAKAIETFEPSAGRYSVHPVPGRATYIFDHKAPFGTIAESLAFIAAARAVRKTVVFGTISDYPGAASSRYRKIARQALAVADRVIFAGPRAGHASKLAQGPLRERLLSFETTYQASEFLKAETMPGELVLLKGSIGVDHLERVVFSQLDRVVCWRNGCGRESVCPACKSYRQPFPPAPYSVTDSPTPVAS